MALKNISASEEKKTRFEAKLTTLNDWLYYEIKIASVCSNPKIFLFKFCLIIVGAVFLV